MGSSGAGTDGPRQGLRAECSAVQKKRCCTPHLSAYHFDSAGICPLDRLFFRHYAIFLRNQSFRDRVVISTQPYSALDRVTSYDLPDVPEPYRHGGPAPL